MLALKRHIALILTLLLLGGMANEAWADVTYHILSLPFTTYESNGSTIRTHNGVTCENIRVEVLKVASSETTVGLQDDFKSPLLKDVAYRYYKTATTKTNVQIYANNGNVKYTVYSSLGGEMTAGSTLADNDNPTDIYVTYDYNPLNDGICTELGQSLKLDGTATYNIEVGSQSFLAYNQVRGNRPGLIPESDLYNIDQISSDNMEEVKTGLYNDYDKKWGKIFYFKWKFYGNDPYNISIVLAYDGDGTYDENGTRTIKNPNSNNSNMIFAQVGANMWVSNESNYEWKSGAWQSKYGWYRGMNPPFNSFAILAHSSANYTLIGTKINSQPNNKNQYMHLNNPNPGLNPKIEFKSASSAAQIKFYKVNEYVFKVTTPLSGTVLSEVVPVSDYYKNDDPTAHIPDALKRKYVTFTGGYKEAGFSNKYASFAAVAADGSAEEDGSGRKVIWLKYETSMPFTTCTKTSPSPTYDDLTWYNFYTNKDVQYIVRYNSTDAAFNTTGTDGSRYARTSHFAFWGDPFEMKIVSRHLTDNNSGTFHYLKLNDPVTGNITQDATGTAFDIVYDDNTDTYAGCFRLREFTSTNNSDNHLTWSYGSGNYPLKGSATQADAVRLTVVSVPKKDFVYHIMRSDHSIAVKATKSQEASTKLDYAHIPDTIRSPFLALAGVTIKFYDTKSKAEAQGPGTDITYAPDATTDAAQDIWVRYDMGTALSVLPGSYITGNTQFNVRLNGQYIYYDSSSGTIKSSATIVDSNSNGSTDDETKYLWTLSGSDPYAMTIKNSDNNQYVSIADGDSDGQPDWADGTISWSVSAPASKYIIKGTDWTGVWEVMAATGDDVDASTDYYNIGRNASTDDTKMYSNDTYRHNQGPLQFQLTPTGAKVVTYHLIDKASTDLLQVTARHITSDTPLFPNDYWSPLVEEFQYWSDEDCTTPLATIGDATIVYVTYVVKNTVDLQKGVMYLLKYEGGGMYRMENGSDGLDDEDKARYPYCNGDCNFFVYGDRQYEIQQQGAASTRTRWAWYLESDNNDPYHVKICSRQTETYNSTENNAYFRTYAVEYDGATHVVTGLTWPGVSGIHGTEYMIMGSNDQYRLLTTQTIPIDLNGDGLYDGENESNERHVVNKFEQYWKTFDTIRKKIYGDNVSNNDLDFNDPSTVPDVYTPYGATSGQKLRAHLQTDLGWHNYGQWAYAKRWNGFNADGAKSKGWELMEHWFQTIDMGEGYFELKKIDIDPVLILLDQHGWEIMRKPLPSGPDDPDKVTKYNAIRPYDSPMVEKYYFWSKTSKRSGFHQYHTLTDQITVDGEPYWSTSLTNLPPYDKADKIKDKKGNLLDQYVTYVVKDEYRNLGVDTKLLVQQGDKYISSSDGSTITKTDVPDGGMSQKIISGVTDPNDLWILKRNANIDNEMGYLHWSHSWTNDYDDSKKVKASGFNSNAFDPYNIQIQSANSYEEGKYKYFVINATGADLDGAGAMKATYSGSATVGLNIKPTNENCDQGATNHPIHGIGQDSRTLDMSNATFMAVADADRNIQLMPRFDHSVRVRDFSTLEVPTDNASQLNEMKIRLYLPIVYKYHIIDNAGNESLCYQSGGDLAPQTPDHFKSPLAKDFQYYTTLTDGEVSDEITESFASATLTDGNVYVRYSYDNSTDANHILDGKWLTMQLNTMDAVYSSGIKQGTSKPEPVNGDDMQWQWKFLETPQSDPDPYAVYLFNRSQSAGTKAIINRFAILSHTSGGYALAEAGTGNYTYNFLSGVGMTTDVAATTALESGFTSTAGSFTGTNSQVRLIDDVEHTFTYKIFTKSSAFAIEEEQDYFAIQENNYVPVVPENIKSPLLKLNQFRYYNKDNFTFSGTDIATADTIRKALNNLYGLYDDIVCVRYLPYDPDDTEYKVPNAKRVIDGHVAKDEANSNDASLDLSKELLYNVIWYNDNMMTTSDNEDVVGHANQSIQTDSKYEWKIGGDDPYAITIYNNSAKKYITAASTENNAACTLTATATTFMLLPTENWEYGALAITGYKDSKLTMIDDGNSESKDAAKITTGTPAKFIIFSLATHKVIYHLIMANIGSYVDIPYSKKDEEGNWVEDYRPSDNKTKRIYGSTKRDIGTYQLGEIISLFDPAESVAYCKDVGQVSLGDLLKVPSELKRPNCKYFYYVHGIYDDAACQTPNSTLNDKYKGLQVDHMGTDEDLLGKTILINIEYQFDDGLPTNNGSDFVLSPTESKWYTFDTSDNTPWLAQYTVAWGLELKEGRASHYTNDYLWAPVGDPYGFVMYNRYMYKSANQPTVVMTTSSAPTSGATFTMAAPNGYEVYELLDGDNDGFFDVHCVYNNSDLYINTTTGIADGVTHTYLCLGSEANATELTFGLSEELVKPYHDRAGYVGGLTNEGKAAYEAVNTNPLYTTDAAKLMAKQAIVYDDQYIVKYTPGYYRLHSQPDIPGVGKRYASGYTHDIEKTENDAASNAGLPMHFYEVEGSGTTFALLRNGNDVLNRGYTSSLATRGDIPIPAVEYDPASIFYFIGAELTPAQIASGDKPTSEIQTQGLWVKGANVSNTSGYTKMTATSGEATTFTLLDIGGAVLLIHDGSVPNERKYLNFDQADPDHIYDLGFYHEVHTDYAKWCMQPANVKGLKITTHSGGDEGSYDGNNYYYSTFYAPFDILLPEDNDVDKVKTYKAFLCDTKISPWNGTEMSPRPISWYNIEENNCPSRIEDEKELFRNNNRFVPAGTPVILSIKNDAEDIKVTLPNSAPSQNGGNPLLSTGFKVKLKGTDLDNETRDNTLMGQYLEQWLGAGSDVYVFGIPYSGTFTKAGDYASSGAISAVLPAPDNTGWGFYLNANPNKESAVSRGEWVRNNWYVVSNRIYYRAPASPPAPQLEGVQFVPVIFDGEEPGEEELQPDGSVQVIGDGCIYDLLGRKVATREQVEDGTWRERLAPGIYILNGKKFKK